VVCWKHTYAVLSITSLVFLYFFCFSMLLYTLDQSVDLFLLKLFVNCLYRMNVV
jgi:hypothetical protein